MFRDQAVLMLDAFRRGYPVEAGVLRRACDVLDLPIGEGRTEEEGKSETDLSHGVSPQTKRPRAWSPGAGVWVR